MMSKKLGVIGHIDHGKTTLSYAIVTTLKNSNKTVKILQDEVNEKPDRGIDVKRRTPLADWCVDSNGKSGQQNRRERRKLQRKK